MPCDDTRQQQPHKAYEDSYCSNLAQRAVYLAGKHINEVYMHLRAGCPVGIILCQKGGAGFGIGICRGACNGVNAG